MEISTIFELTGLLVYFIFICKIGMSFHSLNNEQKRIAKTVNRAPFGKVGWYYIIPLVGLVIGTILLSNGHRRLLYFAFFVFCLAGKAFHNFKIKKNISSVNLPDHYVSSILISNKFLFGGLALVVFSYVIASF